ncbi:MAG: acyltransferase [Sneathiellales bacterium]|nr:acyltransferase [Sneathiellales bacterium]
MNYRPEIDGLRTIAVVPVILFHAGFKIFSGGYVGVDVFFVISGYLITTILVSEFEQGKFSLLTFYERRARRILPALFFVLFACLPFAWMWLLPDYMTDFAQSLIGVVTFSSNFLFWQETGYFNAAAELKPLLHTWSLAVEEQYYIFFPLFLMLVWRFGMRHVLVLLAMVFITSLAIGHWGALHKPEAAFFLLPSRAWELLVGAFAAFYICNLRKFHESLDIKLHQLLSVIGLAMVTYSIFAFDGGTLFPGLPALVPTVGTVLIILFASPGTLVNKVLSSKGLVGIGLISYSAYLWHQPLMVFARHRSLEQPSEMLMGFLCLVTLIMAYISWRYVEKPFREKKATSRKLVFSAGTSFAAITIAIGLFGHFTQGFPKRLPEEVLEFAAEKKNSNPLASKCHFPSLTEGAYGKLEFPAPICVLGPDKENIQVALLGDSHGNAVAYPILKSLEAAGITSTQITLSGCQPFVGFERWAKSCHASNMKIETFIRNSSIRTVIIAARWTSNYYWEMFDNSEGGVEHGSMGPVTYLPEFVSEQFDTRAEKAAELWRKGIRRYLDMGKNVILIYPIPEAGWNVPDQLAKTYFQYSKVESLTTPLKRYLERNGPIISVLDGIEDPKIRRVRPRKIMCDSLVKDRCVNAMGTKVYYHDDDHLSLTGAALLVPNVMKAVKSLESQHSASWSDKTRSVQVR